MYDYYFNSRKDRQMKGTQVQTASYIPKEMKWDTEFDKFMKMLNASKVSYAEWQKLRYRTTVSHKGGIVNGL